MRLPFIPIDTEDIWSTFRRFPLWLQFFLSAALLSLAAAYYVWVAGFSEQLVVSEIVKNRTTDWDDLWFSPRGDLIAVKQSPEEIKVSVWPSGPGESDNRDIRLDADDVRNWQSSSSRYYSIIEAYNKRYPKQSSQGDSSFPYTFAVSRSGKRVALFRSGILTISDIRSFGSSASSIPLLDNDKVTNDSYEVVSLTFTDRDLLAILYRDGRVEIRDPNREGIIVGISNTNVKESSRLWAFGDFLAVVSFQSSAIAILDMKSFQPEVQPKGYPLTAMKSFAVAVSPGSNLALAVGDEYIYFNKAGTQNYSTFRLPGSVKTLAFYDDDTLVVGGDFEGLSVLSQINDQRQKLTNNSEVRLLAINSSRLAYVGDTGTVFLSHRRTPELNIKGRFTISGWVVCFLSLGTVYLGQGIKRRSRTRSSHKNLTTDKLSGRLTLPESLPLDLVQACATGECVLYVGAGLSAQAGFPTWNSFVHDLLDWAVESKFIETHFAESFHSEIDSGHADPVADNIISQVQAQDKLPLLHELLRKVFLKKTKIPNTHQLLKGIKFSAILTTNFDRLIERTYQEEDNTVLTPADTQHLLEALTKREFFILKLYGTLEKPGTVMIAPAQYEEAVNGNRDFSQFMETLFISRTLLFIGASLEGIDVYLRGITLPKNVSRTHYALVAVADNAWRAKADLLERRYGIHVLPYTPSSDYYEVKAFTEKLTNDIAVHSTGKQIVSQHNSRLSRLTLKNIGPFDDLTLNFDDEWNILLGDNGVGKSTILKAIAIALCGEKAQPFAERLIKSGKSYGQVILETNNNTRYETEIRRKGDEAEIISTTARPLLAEGWLAIGFPPLRTVSWRNPQGPNIETKGKSSPSTEDLLPLVKGDPDVRLEALKQWVVNIDYMRSKSEEEQKGQGKRYEKLILDLFDLISRMTDRFKLHYKGIDSRNRILVEVERDGDIPLESISQGLTSLIGWVGVLMQRLHEVYDQDEQPLTRYALVLMDEIDAHMHPAWQQSVVVALKEVFPNIQFIATTHSPLIVVGMPARQLLRLTRDNSGNIQQIEVEPDMTKGRADQILTGELFGLESTRDLETHRLIMRYTELVARDQLSPDEQRELVQAAQKLKVKMPSPAERKEAREAFDLIQTALREKIASIPPEEKKKLIEEVKVQLQEVVTNSRRPQ